MNEINANFNEIVQMIEVRRNNAYKKVKEELISLYWDFGKYISEKIASGEWGNKIVEKLEEFMQNKYPTLKGFNRRGMYRMKQFYETYKDYPEIVSTLLTQLNWSSHLAILSGTNDINQKEFYMKLAIKENYSTRELTRQIKKKYENPSIGIILCANKDDEVVEYAMSRTLSPTLVANIN